MSNLAFTAATAALRPLGLAVFAGVSLVANGALGQTFLGNMGFESPILPLYTDYPPPLTISASNALPKWTPYIRTNEITYTYYNSLTIGSSGVCFFDSNAPTYIPRPFEGDYMVGLIGGRIQGESSIARVGFIPFAAQSVQFKASFDSNLLDVSFAGQSLACYALSNAPNYVLYGADISGFAGQTAELRFTALVGPNSLHVAYLDDIEFSAEPVPEPTPAFLMIGGTAWFFIRCRKRKTGCWLS